MTIRTSPLVARIAGVLLCALAAGAAPDARDYEFHYENVLGTSLELCVRADTEEAARAAEARALGRVAGVRLRTPIGVKLRRRVGLKKWGSPSTMVGWVTT